jgi:2'-5' RNA ligase
LRQFLALELPDSWKDELERRSRDLSADLRGWRWLSIDSIHLTLKFLGNVDAERDRRARSAWAETVAAQRGMVLRLSGTGAFPRRGRPRVLWAGVAADPALETLVLALNRVAEGLGFDRDERRFRPHLTLARARRGQAAERPSETAGAPGPAEFAVERVTLFQSVLHPSGARYTALEHYRLATG